jgi:two-component system, OmpR family, response regulator
VITAESQAEAEKSLERNKPDLVIFDLMMDQEDSGFILAYKLNGNTPICPLSLLRLPQPKQVYTFDLYNETIKAGSKPILYLEKGIRSDQLHREINKLLKL